MDEELTPAKIAELTNSLSEILQVRAETRAGRGLCECGWAICNGPHGVADDCEQPAEEDCTYPDGKPAGKLCRECAESLRTDGVVQFAAMQFGAKLSRDGNA